MVLILGFLSSGRILLFALGNARSAGGVGVCRRLIGMLYFTSIDMIGIKSDLI
jgi:hypothetical protein